MAAAPLFVADMEALRKKLRMENVTLGDPAYDLLEEAVLRVRVGFIRQLTRARVVVLVGYTFSETPTDDDQVLRALANTTEVKWVRMELLRTLPSQFLDGNSAEAVFEEEAPFRMTDEVMRRSEIKRLEKEITDDMDLLSGSEIAGAESKARATTFSPATTPPRPSASVFNEDTVQVGGFDIP